MDKDEIFNKLKACVGEVLLVEEEDLIQPDSDLVNDLGAESIDFVEILHSLEKIFDVKIPRDEIYPNREFFTDRKYLTKDRKVTQVGVDKLISSYPYLDKNKIMEYQSLTQYLNSISLIVDFLEYKMADR